MPRKDIELPEEDMIFDALEGDFDEEDMIHTFTQVAEASVEHMKVACSLTQMIVESNAKESLSADEILKIFRKSSDTILDCTPLKALFDKV